MDKIWMKPFNCLVSDGYIRTSSSNKNQTYVKMATLDKPTQIVYEDRHIFAAEKVPNWGFDKHCIDKNKKI